MVSKIGYVTNGAATSTGSFPSTSTGGPGYVTLGQPVRQLSVAVTHASTKQVAWMLQGTVGNSTAWTNLNAAASSSTGSAIVSSTVGHVVTRARINVSGNESTGNITSEWYIVGVE